MRKKSNSQVAIVGMGHVGRGLALAFRVAGIRRVPVGRADIVLLAVRDNQITRTAREIAPRLAPRTCVLHTSGIAPCDALESLSGRGFALGSMHPLLSFANPRRAAAQVSEATFALSGDQCAIAAARKLIRRLGAHVVTIRDRDKPLYHAAAVFAANYLVANFSVACDLLARIGIDDHTARRLFAPLARGVLENIVTHGAARALSGPISRGDVTTLRAHLAALPHESHRRLYAALGEVIVDLAKISPSQKSQLRRTLHARGD
ncbi:MAG: DUF2520 domain-containing protein [Deltaproteobacteria bacterium]|nr:DUF2520 domain-containing protein [Deltaproteobacteria bacterium]